MARKQRPRAAHHRIQQLTIPQFERMFPDEDACKAYLVAHRWPDGVTCPRCGSAAVYALESRPFHWQCQHCSADGYRFSVLVGTVFENTNKPLRDWFRVIHLMLTSKKGISALQVFRLMGFGSYKTAWYMCHRVRAGMQDEQFRKLVGIVEVDETYIGGAISNKHKSVREKRARDRRRPTHDDDDDYPSPGPFGSGKVGVVGAVQRKGNVVARVIDAPDRETLQGFVDETVSQRVSLLVTDNHGSYRSLKRRYPHRIVNHEAGDYVVGAVHTNTIEGFWSIMKRGIMGTYHKVSRKYLPLYVAEFQFRYNNRGNADIFGAAIAGC